MQIGLHLQGRRAQYLRQWIIYLILKQEELAEITQAFRSVVFVNMRITVFASTNEQRLPFCRGAIRHFARS